MAGCSVVALLEVIRLDEGDLSIQRGVTDE